MKKAKMKKMNWTLRAIVVEKDWKL